MKLNVERQRGRRTMVEVPDNASSTLAATLIAYELDYGPFDGSWRVGTGSKPHGDHADVVYLQLEQTVAELDGPDVFLTIEPEGIARWN